MKRTKFALIVAASVVSIVTLSLIAHSEIIDSELAGRWIFKEASGITAYDSSGFGDDGTLSGAASFTTDSQRSHVLEISGISGVVEIPYDPRLEPYRGTVSVWVKPSLDTWGDIVQHSTDKLMRCGTSLFGGAAYALQISSNGIPMAIFANDDPKTCSKWPQTVVRGPANAVRLNKWTHLAMRWDGVSMLTLFADGKLVGKSSYSPNPTFGLSYHGDTGVIVGTQPGGNLSFYGSVSDLRIYSRALSDTEITNIYLNQQ